MDEKPKHFFWPSYVDLMTALFAVTLVLFVLSFKLFKDRQAELQAERDKYQVLANEYERIKKVDQQIKALEKTGAFIYDSVYKRFVVKDFVGQELFDPQSDVIKPEFYGSALNAGTKLLQLIKDLNQEQHIRFLLLIEGNTANKFDGSYERDSEYGYNLSYRRALALYKLWKANGIVFDFTTTEIIMAGSGFSGIGRDSKEENNKRFLIQIIPKIN